MEHKPIQGICGVCRKPVGSCICKPIIKPEE